MFNEDFEPAKKEKLPTLSQYLKKLPANTKELQQNFQVDIIWTPGTFDNFTLQTHKFRLIIPKEHALYKHLSEAMENEAGFNVYGSFGISVSDRKNGKFTLAPRPKDKGQWERLSDNGFKFKSN